MPSPNVLYSVAQLRDIEGKALAGLPPGTLMQRAGTAAAEVAQSLIGAAGTCHAAPVLVLAGPGNNGGDAMETAVHLAAAGCNVQILHFADTAHLPSDAQGAFKRAQKSTAIFADIHRWRDELAAHDWQLVIDGLFGIGLSRPLDQELSDLVRTLDTVRCPVLALDVPSGLDADTGMRVAAGAALRATHTLTFIGNKPGLHTGEGRDYAGKVTVADLDIDAACFPGPDAQLASPELFADRLQPRRHGSHKGSYGDAMILGGAHGMSGAVVLAARAAAKCGAGRVFAGFLDAAPAYDGIQPELMCRDADNLDMSGAALVIGPGLGVSRRAHDLVAKALHQPAPLVLDADALNLIAAEPGLQSLLMQRRHSALLTPHPLEAARLLGCSVQQVQADRLQAARELANRLRTIAVLKGSGSIIARPDQQLVLNPTGNPALATAGSGDVLAGVCGALLAQGWPEWEAAIAATWLHGHAADQLVAQGTGPIGLTASELIPQIRTALNTMTERHAQHAAR